MESGCRQIKSSIVYNISTNPSEERKYRLGDSQEKKQKDKRVERSLSGQCGGVVELRKLKK